MRRLRSGGPGRRLKQVCCRGAEEGRSSRGSAFLCSECPRPRYRVGAPCLMVDVLVSDAIPMRKLTPLGLPTPVTSS